MTNKQYLFAVILFFFLAPPPSFGQNNRLNTSNQIGWYAYFGTFKISKKVGIHTEYQFRRNNWISDWQQSLLRVGVNYNPIPNLQLRTGYGWIETFPYGEYPIKGLGNNTPNIVFIKWLNFLKRLELWIFLTDTCLSNDL